MKKGRNTGGNMMRTQPAGKAASSKPSPLVFKGKPGSNFTFGHQLIKTPLGKTKPYYTARKEEPKTITIDFKKALEEPPETEKKEDSYIEIPLRRSSIESSEDDITTEELELLKKQLNDKATERSQNTTISVKGTIIQAQRQKALEDLLEKMRVDLCEHKELIQQLNVDFEQSRRKYAEELEELRGELASCKARLREKNELYKSLEGENEKLRSTMSTSLTTLIECKGTLNNYNEFVQESAKITGDSSFSTSDAIQKIQMSASLMQRLHLKSGITEKFNNIIAEIKSHLFSNSKPDSISKLKANGKKYETQLSKLKAENEELAKEADQLEQAVGAFSKIHPSFLGEELRWNPAESIEVKRERDFYKDKCQSLLQSLTKSQKQLKDFPQQMKLFFIH